MSQAKKGDNVKIHYTGSLKDGTVFDSSLERDPLEFSLGQGMVIEGFENAVEGMAVGDTKTVEIPPDQGYGQHNPEMVITVEKRQMPPDIVPEIGMMLEVNLENGGKAHVTVTKLEDEVITLDGNHPLAGKDLIFELNLVEIA